MPVFYAKCPLNNNDDKTMPFVVGGAEDLQTPMLCKACGMQAFAADSDKDPRTGNFAVTLNWGRNVVKDSKGAAMFDESMLDGYTVQIVNDKGVALSTKIGNEQIVVMKKSFTGTACCNPTAYSVSVKGAWPAGGSAFTIKPWKATAGETFILPIGSVTGAFTDVTTGSMNLVAMDTTFGGMTEGHAKSMADNPNNKDIVATALVAAANGKFTKDQVYVTKVAAKKSARRLAESAARKLSGWQVDTSYEVLLAASETFAITDLNTTALSASIEAQAGVKVGEVKTTIDATKSMVLDGDDSPITGAATRNGVLVSFFALLLALKVIA